MGALAGATSILQSTAGDLANAVAEDVSKLIDIAKITAFATVSAPFSQIVPAIMATPVLGSFITKLGEKKEREPVSEDTGKEIVDNTKETSERVIETDTDIKSVSSILVEMRDTLVDIWALMASDDKLERNYRKQAQKERRANMAKVEHEADVKGVDDTVDDLTKDGQEQQEDNKEGKAGPFAGLKKIFRTIMGHISRFAKLIAVLAVVLLPEILRGWAEIIEPIEDFVKRNKETLMGVWDFFKSLGNWFTDTILIPMRDGIFSMFMKIGEIWDTINFGQMWETIIMGVKEAATKLPDFLRNLLPDSIGGKTQREMIDERNEENLKLAKAEKNKDKGFFQRKEELTGEEVLAAKSKTLRELKDEGVLDTNDPATKQALIAERVAAGDEKGADIIRNATGAATNASTPLSKFAPGQSTGAGNAVNDMSKNVNTAVGPVSNSTALIAIPEKGSVEIIAGESGVQLGNRQVDAIEQSSLSNKSESVAVINNNTNVTNAPVTQVGAPVTVNNTMNSGAFGGGGSFSNVV